MGVLIGGPTPQDGKSAYQIWLGAGNVGTQQQFLDSLKGDKGDKGDPGASGSGFIKGEIRFGKFDLTKFDSSGVGVVGSEYDGWGLADGRFGRDDMRGFTPAGGINYGAGTLDPMVDPAQHLNDPDYNVTVGAKRGEVKHAMSIAELAKHSHSYQDPGHRHREQQKNGQGAGGSSGDFARSSYNADPNSYYAESATIGITIDSTGTSMPFNVVQPTKYFAFIQKL